MNKLISLLSLSFLFSFSSFSSAHDLMAAIQSEDRSPKNIARDEYRNPAKTLTFFQIKPDMRVIELSPGGGWYTEILANYIHNPGVVIAAHFDADSKIEYFRKSRERFEKKVIEKSMYDNVYIVNLSSELAKEGSVDAVLTFRNLHNWLGPQMDLIFSNSFKALKSGGLFGIVEHRANPGTSISDMKKSGYVTEAHAIEIAEKHGFVLVEKSEINANPKDTKDHPRGVWTLPPNLSLKEIDREKYEAIGESDRMTLLFKKP